MATSARVTATIEHAEARRARERRALRMLGIPLLAVVMIPAFTTSPRPSLHRDGLGVPLAAAALLVAFAAVVRRAPRLEREGGGEAATVAWLVLMAAAGVA